MKTNESLTYGELAKDLAEEELKVDPPAEVKLKEAKDFRIIGNEETKRLDTPEKVNGSAEFGIDVRRNEMVFASVERGDVIGRKITAFDETAARKRLLELIPDVIDVVKIKSGIAVIAKNTWAAFMGRDEIHPFIKWDERPKNERLSTLSISERLAHAAGKPANPDDESYQVHQSEGDAQKQLEKSGADSRIQQDYEVPFLAHAPMEPPSCTAWVQEHRCDIWAATQLQGKCRESTAELLGYKEDQVHVHTTLLGGGFGRRIAMDFIADAVWTAQKIGTPVQVTWKREDDMMHSAYRPAAYARFEGSVDAAGWPVAWKNRLVCDFSGISEGACRIPYAYAIPNFMVDSQKPEPNFYLQSKDVRLGEELPREGVAVTYWRSVNYSQNTFFVESFLDQLAERGRRDPVELRKKLLSAALHNLENRELTEKEIEKFGKSVSTDPDPDIARWHLRKTTERLLHVLEKVEEFANWKPGPLPPDKEGAKRGRGIAIGETFGTCVAQVVEVSVGKLGHVKVDRVVAVVDCGTVVNPGGVVQQTEGGIIFGLTAALKGKISIDAGIVKETNIGNSDYGLLRMHEVPEIKVHRIKSTETPTGMGEPTVPPAAPALCNAIFHATRKRIWKLPIDKELLKA